MTGKRRTWYDPVKRVLDVGGAVVGLVVLSPVLAITACVVAANLGRPILFVQPRPGRDARVFRLVKFRTMRAAAAGEGVESDAGRLTPFGRRLRSTSLDELPTLWNVLRGDMSFVGPRPLLVEYLDRYTPEQARRHEVRPGITGLAQVSGRNAVTWEDRFSYDVAYVDRRSIALDTAILLRTVSTVLTRRGIAEQGHVTMSEYRGDLDR